MRAAFPTCRGRGALPPVLLSALCLVLAICINKDMRMHMRIAHANAHAHAKSHMRMHMRMPNCTCECTCDSHMRIANANGTCECTCELHMHMRIKEGNRGSGDPGYPGNPEITGANILITAPTGDQTVWCLPLLGGKLFETHTHRGSNFLKPTPTGAHTF